MFTGLIQRLGKVRRVSFGRSLVMEFGFEPWPQPLMEGESVAVNGVCLTVVAHGADRFTADVLDETARRSTLASFVPGRLVNLERAVRAGEPLGGHIVQGHVDGVGEVLEVVPRSRDVQLRVKCGPVIAAATVMKGSIAIDGVSLTVSGLGKDWLAVDLIPETRRATTLGKIARGDHVNLESDVLGRYAMRAPAEPAEGGLTMEMLAENGFL